eukprot:TRINITY_DN114_c2_g1_i1.p1 TRINITY_DN114_c2_g1~~TRINITY_DN114_c2_g1_i1.p1  ORF type:complete len:118 (-),score=40.45 TRINITY_DN114_c2_g1_i1:152-505(-)
MSYEEELKKFIANQKFYSDYLKIQQFPIDSREYYFTNEIRDYNLKINFSTFSCFFLTGATAVMAKRGFKLFSILPIFFLPVPFDYFIRQQDSSIQNLKRVSPDSDQAYENIFNRIKL